MRNTTFLTINKKYDSIIDLTLTPQNAVKYGYEYIGDINYDLIEYHTTTEDVLKLFDVIQYKIGKPVNTNNDATFYGIYSPKKKCLS